MNPIDHPMGGGEGRTAGGRNPCSPDRRAGQGRQDPQEAEAGQQGDHPPPPAGPFQQHGVIAGATAAR